VIAHPSRRRDLLLGSIVALVLVSASMGRPLSLDDGAACPGMMELVLSVVLRAFPTVSVGAALSWTNGGIAFAALACFVRLLQIVTGSTAAAAAIALALWTTPAFDRALAPATGVALLGLASWAWMGLRSGSRISAIAVAIGGFALFVPPLAIPASVLVCALLIWQWKMTAARLLLALGLNAALVAVAIGLAAGAPPQSDATPLAHGIACTLQLEWQAIGTAIRTDIVAMATSLGPLPIALAALGAFTSLAAVRRPAAWIAAGAAVAPLAAAASGSSAGAAFVPLSASIWCLAAIGVAEVIRETEHHYGFRKTAALTLTALLVALVVLLQVQSFVRADPIADRVTLGHERLTVERFGAAASPVTARMMVDEDASTAIVLRASGVSWRIVPRRAPDVRDAVAAGRVVALPRAQLELQRQAIVLRSTASDVVAEVTEARACVAVGRRWTDASALLASPRFTFVATRPGAMGPITIYFGADDGLAADAVGWIARARRGFNAQAYTRQERPDLGDALRAQDIHEPDTLLNAPHVLRLILWRTPDTPDVLPIALNARPTSAVVRADPAPAARFVELCPWFEYPVEGFR
jgi:hypothetical protein